VLGIYWRSKWAASGTFVLMRNARSQSLLLRCWHHKLYSDGCTYSRAVNWCSFVAISLRFNMSCRALHIALQPFSSAVSANNNTLLVFPDTMKPTHTHLHFNLRCVLLSREDEAAKGGPVRCYLLSSADTTFGNKLHASTRVLM